MAHFNRKLLIQHLESRRMMAVAASESEAGGESVLTIVGDRRETVAGAGTADFVEIRRVSQDPENFVNPSRFSVTANFDQDAQLERRIFGAVERFVIDLGLQDDTLRIRNIRPRDFVQRIIVNNMGQGADLVTFDTVAVDESINILTGRGNDAVFLSNVISPGNFGFGRTRIRTGSGEDLVQVGFTPVFASNDGAVTAGDEQDDAPTVADLAPLVPGVSSPAEEAIGMDIESFFLNAGSSANQILPDNDTVSIADSIFGDIEVRLGFGDDELSVDGNEFTFEGTRWTEARAREATSTRYEATITPSPLTMAAGASL